ncbi:MAG: Hpt domain-containing protein [Gemmatimonadota bacterium]
MTMVRPTAIDATPPPEMYDALALVQRIGGAALLDKVITLFRASAEDRRVKLAAAIRDGDLLQVSRLSHAMKGSAAQVGAEGLRAVAASLEKEIGVLDPPAIAERYEHVVDEIGTAVAQLEAYRATVAGAP